MKKTTIAKSALLIACLALTSACAKEKLSKKYIQSQGDVTFYGYDAEANSTKTTLDGTSIKWCPGDQIMVYQGTLSSGKFTSTATETCATTSFSGNIPYIIGGQEADPETSNIWAVYPYSAACGCDGSSVTVKIDAEQTAQEGTFASGIFPSVAKSSSYSLAFYNVCGGVKFTVAQSGIKKVVFKGKNSEELAGTVNVGFVDGLPVINDVTGAVDSIIVNAPTSDGFIPGDEYFIVAIPAEFTDGFTITYSNDYGATKYAAGFAVKIKRKTFGVVSQKDTVGILFRDPVAKAACVEKFDANADGEISFTEAKVPTTLEGLFEYHDEVQYFPELENFTSVTDLKGCFNGCSQLLEVEIPAFINAIGEKAFYGCTSLSSIEIPSSIPALGKMSFYGCSSMSSIEIPSSVKTIGSEAFRNCTSLSSITFNEGLESLDARAFYNIGASELTLPASLKSIGNRTFGNETTCIIMNGTVPPTLASVSFGTATVFYVPDEVLSAYNSAEGWQEFEDYIFPISEYVPDLSAKGTANCYIVNRRGKFKFKAMVKGGSTESVGIPVSAEVLWESFGTSTTPSVGDVVKNVSLDAGYVMFNTPATLNNGNAVIAVKDASGNILWSWHIWVCKDFDPDATAQVYNNNAGTMMDRNLGAVSATPGAVGSCGLLYQWGRKDPFLGGSCGYDSAASTLSWPGTVSSSSSTGTNAYAAAHPTTFITRNSNNYDWYYTGSSSTDNTRWQTSENDKGMYDPCPAGWRVPDGGSSGVWSTAFGSSSWYGNGPWDSTNKGMNFGSGNGKSSRMQLGTASTIWYSAAGYRDGGNGTLYYDYGYYWSCTPDGYHVFGLIFASGGGVTPSNGGGLRAYGKSVRCMKELD